MLTEDFGLIKKLTAILLITLFVFTLFACKGQDEDISTSDMQSTSEETTLGEELTTDENSVPVSGNAQPIKFSSAKAKRIGTFESDVYGKMILWLQDGYFLMFNDFNDHVLTVNAQNYSPVEACENNVISADMNFDGKTDFGVCYYMDTLNSYYFCFLWDSTQKTYNYYLPLSSIANPEFIRSTATVKETKKITFTEATENRYSVGENGLTLLSSKNISEETTTATSIGNELIDPEFSYMENGNSALLSVKSGGNKMKWECFIEDPGIVCVSSEYFDNITKVYEFLLSAVSEGATTVILRYVSSDSDETLQEINLNVIVGSEKTVSVIVP